MSSNRLEHFRRRHERNWPLQRGSNRGVPSSSKALGESKEMDRRRLRSSKKRRLHFRTRNRIDYKANLVISGVSKERLENCAATRCTSRLSSYVGIKSTLAMIP